MNTRRGLSVSRWLTKTPLEDRECRRVAARGSERKRAAAVELGRWIFFRHSTHLESSWNAKQLSGQITATVAAASRCSELGGKLTASAPVLEDSGGGLLHGYNFLFKAKGFRSPVMLPNEAGLCRR